LDLVLEALGRGTEEPYLLTPDGAKRIEAALVARIEAPDFKPAVREVLLFAFHLSAKLGAPTAAGGLFAVVETLVPHMKKRGIDAAPLEQVLDGAKRQAAQFLGQGSGRENAGKPVPAGAVKWWQRKNDV
jgi:hypothetical protein